MTAPSASVGYRFGRFELQPSERRLLADGVAVRIGPHAFDMLTLLAERGGQLVGKQELLAQVWRGVVVEENTVQVHVAALRKVLGADSIATVSGRGYRLVPEVERVDGTPAHDASARRHNLPLQLTSFIGRDEETTKVRQLLASARLVTLTGAGGCGKTRLALEVAAGSVENFADGGWLAEFAPLSDASLIPQTVANALGLKEQARRSLTDTIAQWLETRHLLLVMDNAEQLLGGCAEFVDLLLRRCARLAVLVTSRERLGIDGEHTFRVPSMSMLESTRLFVERARLQQPQFDVTEANAPQVDSICRQLDGIPLAIELAAARVRSMSVAEVSHRLDQRFSLLTGGSRTALPRHRTLRSLIDWSYDHLSGAERALLNRVSVFSGGWGLEAAEQVCADEHIGAAQVLDLLTALVDKSLVGAEDRAGVTRYGLLETVRQYAREQLLESGEERHFQRQHMVCYRDLAERAVPHLNGSEQLLWLDQLEADHDNFRSALAWSSTSGDDPVHGLRLANSLRKFWLMHGHVGEGRAWLTRLLSSPASEGTIAFRAKALVGAGAMAYLQGDFQAAQAWYQESLDLQRTLGNQRGMATALGNLGTIAEVHNDFETARALLEEALVIYRALGPAVELATTLVNLGEVARGQGDFAAAKASLEEGLGIGRDLGDRRHMAYALTFLGNLARNEGDCAKAMALLEEALSMHEAVGDPAGISFSFSRMGLVRLDQGDHDTARSLLKDALRIQQEQCDHRFIAVSLEALAAVASSSGQAGLAARLWGHAEHLREALGTPIAPVDRSWHDGHVARARAACADPAAFDAAWQQGRAMTLEHAVQHALQA